jgi:muconolactone delta-isomerase
LISNLDPEAIEGIKFKVRGIRNRSLKRLAVAYLSLIADNPQFGALVASLQLKKKGKVLEGYTKAGLKGGVIIFDVESAAELNGLMLSLPLYTFLETEIYPLLDNEESLAQMKKASERMKAR